jgi:hypothetical protein
MSFNFRVRMGIPVAQAFILGKVLSLAQLTSSVQQNGL